MTKSSSFHLLPDDFLTQYQCKQAPTKVVMGDAVVNDAEVNQFQGKLKAVDLKLDSEDTKANVKLDPYVALEQEALQRQEHYFVHDELQRVLVTAKVLVLTAEDLIACKDEPEKGEEETLASVTPSDNKVELGASAQLARSLSAPSTENDLKVETTLQRSQTNATSQASPSMGDPNAQAATIAARIRGMDHMIGLYLEHRHQVTNTPLGLGMERSSSSSSSHAPSTSMTSPNSWIDTSLQLDGWCIRHASVIAKITRAQSGSPTNRSNNPFARPKHNPTGKGGGVPHLHLTRSMSNSAGGSNFSTQLIQPDHPWVLQQVLAAHRDLAETATLINKQLRYLENPTEIGSNPIEFFVPMLAEMCDRLKRARNMLLKPNRLSFPQQHPVEQPWELFTPPVGEDTVLEFNVQNDELIVDLIAIQPASKVPEKASMKGDTWFRDNRSYIGKTFWLNRRCVEVIDHAQVRFTIHTFQQVLAATQDALAVVTNIHEKFKVLQSVQQSSKGKGCEILPVIQVADPEQLRTTDV